MMQLWIYWDSYMKLINATDIKLFLFSLVTIINVFPSRTFVWHFVFLCGKKKHYHKIAHSMSQKLTRRKTCLIY